VLTFCSSITELNNDSFWRLKWNQAQNGRFVVFFKLVLLFVLFLGKRIRFLESKDDSKKKKGETPQNLCFAVLGHGIKSACCHDACCASFALFTAALRIKSLQNYHLQTW